MSIQTSHTPMSHGGTIYDLTHLNATGVIMAGQGREGGDIRIRISFQSHVYSENCDAGTPERFQDEGDAWRVLCPNRHALSLQLGASCNSCVTDNWLTWESRDRNGIISYMTVDPASDVSYAIFYRLAPSLSDHFDVELIVKSAYVKVNIQKNPRKYNVQQLIKKCHFQ